MNVKAVKRELKKKVCTQMSCLREEYVLKDSRNIILWSIKWRRVLTRYAQRLEKLHSPTKCTLKSRLRQIPSPRLRIIIYTFNIQVSRFPCPWSEASPPFPVAGYCRSAMLQTVLAPGTCVAAALNDTFQHTHTGQEVITHMQATNSFF